MLTNELVAPQLMVMQWLVSHEITFSSDPMEGASGLRAWAFKLQVGEDPGTEIWVNMQAVPPYFVVSTVISNKDEGGRFDDLMVCLLESLPVVRMTRFPTDNLGWEAGRLMVKAEFPIGHDPPHQLTQATVQCGVDVIVAAVMLLQARFPGRTAPVAEHFVGAFRRGEAAISPPEEESLLGPSLTPAA